MLQFSLLVSMGQQVKQKQRAFRYPLTVNGHGQTMTMRGGIRSVVNAKQPVLEHALQNLTMQPKVLRRQVSQTSADSSFDGYHSKGYRRHKEFG